MCVRGASKNTEIIAAPAPRMSASWRTSVSNIVAPAAVDTASAARRSASSVRLRSVMSIEMPQTA